ncbi:MAG TPA: IS1595 family transposase [Candidatus Angelobacter sp.]
MERSIKTLQQAIQHFSNEQTCIDAIAAVRWPDGKPVCPACGHREHYYLATQKRWKCKECWKQFSIKVGTIFEDSPIPLSKWVLAMWMVGNCKNGVSSWEIHRAIGVTQKTAWFMLHRIRLSMHRGSFEVKLGGEGKEIELDETFIGGKARNMHASRRRRLMVGQRGIINKTIVFGMKERGGDVRAHVIEERNKTTLHPIIKDNVSKGSALYTDEWLAYDGLKGEYEHEVINHAEKYVDGLVHTNGMENFWSLLKRGLNGTYVSVEPFHLFRYIDEQAFRYNNRGNKKNPVHDGQRFEMMLAQIAGKRVTYKELTGKVGLSVEGTF